MIYVSDNTASPTGCYSTLSPERAVSVARRWHQLGRLYAIDVMVGGGDQPLRSIRVPLGTHRATVAAIRAAMSEMEA